MPPKCRSGCPTQNHRSYADCARGLQFAPSGTLLTMKQKAENRELDAYEAARRQGVQPDGTTMAKVEKAMKISDATGVAYGG